MPRPVAWARTSARSCERFTCSSCRSFFSVCLRCFRPEGCTGSGVSDDTTVSADAACRSSNLYFFISEHITHSPDGVDRFNLEGIVDLLAEIADVYVYNIRISREIISPHIG